MIQDVLRAIGGVGVYGAISIVLFFSVFVGTVIWTLTLKKSYLGAMGALPLEHEGDRADRGMGGDEAADKRGGPAPQRWSQPLPSAKRHGMERGVTFEKGNSEEGGYGHE